MKSARQGSATRRSGRPVSASIQRCGRLGLHLTAQAGEMVIFNMRAKKAGYNLIDNNCQNFALAMLDAIQIGAHRAFATSFTVYKEAIDGGSVSQLFAGNMPDEDQVQSLPGGQSVVEHAHDVMDEHTTKLDNHHSLF